MKVLVVYHSWFGNTKKAAIAIAEGIKQAGKVHVECQSVKQAKVEESVSSDLLVFGSATHLGNMTGKMRGFIRRLKKFEVRDKKGAAFDTRFAGMKNGALEKIEKILGDLGMEIVVPGLPVIVGGMRGPLRDEEIEKCSQFGQKLAVVLK